MFTGAVDTGGIPMNLHTFAVRIVSKEKKIKLNCNELRSVKGNLSNLPLGEVVDCGMVLGAVVAKIVGTRRQEVSEPTLSISASEPVELHIH